MYFNKEKKCFVNDDGSKMKPTKSLVHYGDKAYAKYLRDGLITANVEFIDNSGLWKDNPRHGSY